MPRPSNVSPGTAVIVFNSKGQVLMMLRKGSHLAGHWSIPGGWIDHEDETVPEAAAREALEEVGITIIGNRTLLGITKENHGEYSSVTIYYRIFPHQYMNSEPVIMEPEKCECLEWFDIENLPSPLFPGLEKMIKSQVHIRDFIFKNK